jgi:hypothetical protein
MASDFLETHKTILDEILLVVPNVKGSKAFGYPAYKIGGKIFAFVGGKGAAMKLPEARVGELIGSRPFLRAFEVAEGVIWKSWLSIDPADPKTYHELESLFLESISFVAGG